MKIRPVRTQTNHLYSPDQSSSAIPANLTTVDRLPGTRNESAIVLEATQSATPTTRATTASTFIRRGTIAVRSLASGLDDKRSQARVALPPRPTLRGADPATDG